MPGLHFSNLYVKIIAYLSMAIPVMVRVLTNVMHTGTIPDIWQITYRHIVGSNILISIKHT
jgi:hypothetical protein